jgi:hypothetical protein
MTLEPFFSLQSEVMHRVEVVTAKQGPLKPDLVCPLLTARSLCPPARYLLASPTTSPHRGDFIY